MRVTLVSARGSFPVESFADQCKVLREHALFCVRNLMLNNPANQAIIKEMDPIGVLSETGELLPVPEKMKKKSIEATTAEEK